MGQRRSNFLLFRSNNDFNKCNINGCLWHHNSNNVMKKKVINVTSGGDFESQYGHFYKWMIEFEDMTAEEHLEWLHTLPWEDLVEVTCTDENYTLEEYMENWA